VRGGGFVTEGGQEINEAVLPIYIIAVKEGNGSSFNVGILDV
jgi:hypothetical protein